VAPVYKVVGSEIIKWDVVKADDVSMDLLPSMKTDISIKTPEKYIIIDTKYYENALQKHYKETVHSANLYQLFAYVKNIEQRGAYYKNCEGILLYPTVGTNLNLQYEVQGHKVCVRTINLANEWRDIHIDLMKIIGIDVSDKSACVGSNY